VAVTVVDQLEAVQVEIEQTDTLSVAACLRERIREPVEKEAAVREARERIVVRLALERQRQTPAPAHLGEDQVDRSDRQRHEQHAGRERDPAGALRLLSRIPLGVQRRLREPGAQRRPRRERVPLRRRRGGSERLNGIERGERVAVGTDIEPGGVQRIAGASQVRGRLQQREPPFDERAIGTERIGVRLLRLLRIAGGVAGQQHEQQHDERGDEQQRDERRLARGGAPVGRGEGHPGT
jgi:hypothetical protein